MKLDKRVYSEMMPLNANKMGNGSELLQYPQYKRLSKYNEFHRSNEYKRIAKFINEIARIIAALDLPEHLRYDILKYAKKFYKSFPSGVKCRDYRILAPVSVYIVCLERFIFINRSRLSNYNNCTVKEFDKCLTLIFRKHRNIYTKFMSKEFRMKTILTQLMGLKAHFGYPEAFYNIAADFLNMHYEKLKLSKISVITIRIARLTKDSLGLDMSSHPIVKACEFLGAHPSNCSRIEQLIKRGSS